jgi:hypothetical protein
VQSALDNMALRRTPWQAFRTTPGMVAFIDSVLAGAFGMEAEDGRPTN